MLPDPIIHVSDIVAGKRILVLQEGRMWPAIVINEVFEGVFQVEMEGAMRHKDVIMARDDILRDGVLEIVPSRKEQLPYGSRVCVIWSKAYNCLFPATVEEPNEEVLVADDMVQVVLDDGDDRQVEIHNVRMLPRNMPHVGEFALRKEIHISTTYGALT